MENNGFLLDTHIFIWAMEENKSLSVDLKTKIRNPKNKIYISVGTIWEIVIKITTKKLKLNFDIESSIQEVGMEILPIQISHVFALASLPLYHNDPFDRILLAQAQSENLTLITSDEKIWKYDVLLLKVERG